MCNILFCVLCIITVLSVAGLCIFLPARYRESYNKQFLPPLNYFTANPYHDELYFFYDPQVTCEYGSNHEKNFDPTIYDDPLRPQMSTVFGENNYIRYYP